MAGAGPVAGAPAAGAGVGAFDAVGEVAGDVAGDEDGEVEGEDGEGEEAAAAAAGEGDASAGGTSPLSAPGNALGRATCCKSRPAAQQQQPWRSVCTFWRQGRSSNTHEVITVHNIYTCRLEVFLAQLWPNLWPIGIMECNQSKRVLDFPGPKALPTAYRNR